MTHDMELVLGDIVDDCAIYGVVDDVAGHLLAETALELAEGNMALAETGQLMCAANLLELFGDIVLIVVLAQGHGEAQLYGRKLFLADVHCLAKEFII